MLHILKDKAALNVSLADFIVRVAKESVIEHGKFSWVISGGSTPRDLYALLAQETYRAAMPWANTFIFWADERNAPFEDEQNNARMAYKVLIDKVDIPKNQVFPIQGGADPDTSAADYALTIKKYFKELPPRFDLILLGMGANAHTASLFPMTSVLDEKNAWVKALFVSEVNMFRITLTAPLINMAKHVVLMVAGNDKADTLYEVLESDKDPHRLPVQLIHPKDGSLHWFVDEAAAARLKNF